MVLAILKRFHHRKMRGGYYHYYVECYVKPWAIPGLWNPWGIVRFGRMNNASYLVSLTPSGIYFGWMFYTNGISWRGRRFTYWN